MVRPKNVDYARITEEELWVSMLALSFMHCKNVQLAEQRPSRQMLRQAERSRQAIDMYRTLDIVPMQTVPRSIAAYWRTM